MCISLWCIWLCSRKQMRVGRSCLLSHCEKMLTVNYYAPCPLGQVCSTGNTHTHTDTHNLGALLQDCTRWEGPKLVPWLRSGAFLYCRATLPLSPWLLLQMSQEAPCIIVTINPKVQRNQMHIRHVRFIMYHVIDISRPTLKPVVLVHRCFVKFVC